MAQQGQWQAGVLGGEPHEPHVEEPPRPGSPPTQRQRSVLPPEPAQALALLGDADYAVAGALGLTKPRFAPIRMCRGPAVRGGANPSGMAPYSEWVTVKPASGCLVRRYLSNGARSSPTPAGPNEADSSSASAELSGSR